MMKILLPIDGSDEALAAVRHAIRLVDEGLQASFVLANVQAPANLYEIVSAPDIGVLEEVSTSRPARTCWRRPRRCCVTPGSRSKARSAPATRATRWSTWPRASAAT